MPLVERGASADSERGRVLMRSLPPSRRWPPESAGDRFWSWQRLGGETEVTRAIVGRGDQERDGGGLAGVRGRVDDLARPAQLRRAREGSDALVADRDRELHGRAHAGDAVGEAVV